jgi:phosphoglycolate phosphatase
MRFRAVLFDLDGTLLDTIQDLADAMNTVLERHDLQPHPVGSYKLFVGNGMELLVRRALGQQAPEELVMQCLEQMRSEYAACMVRTTRPYAGIEQMLDGLAARGLILSVLSNKPNAMTREMVQTYFGRWSFAQVYGARSGVPHKPDATAALDIAASLNIDVTEFLYLGDSATDMQTAHSAGMFAVGALWGFRDREELLQGGAAALVSTPIEVLGLVE